jgi:DNA-binding winged helix-turn-helix (wHTH) protein
MGGEVSSSNGNRTIRFADFELDAQSGELLRNGQPVRIQPQPLRVLRVLLERPGQTVSREELRLRVWGEATYVEFDQGLNYCIRQIRLALGDSAAKPIYIETAPRQGYRFVPQVMTPGALVEMTAGAAQGRTRAVAFGVLAAGLVIAGIWTYAARRPEIGSIAVLPLDNLSGDTSQEYFAEGMTDELITMLAKGSTLRVVSRTSVMAYRGARRPLTEIARSLGADAVLEGRLRAKAIAFI